jgi:virulence-associated protein VapD
MHEDITWKSIMYNLPRNILQFAVKASIDVLPTNANLRRWGKRSNSKCIHCGGNETLHHVRNNCKSTLERLKWRHDSILNFITSKIKSSTNSFKVFSDLPNLMEGISTIPVNVAITSLKPDIVCIDFILKKCVILELTVPFEMNIDDAKERKTKKYEHLVNDIEDNGYEVVYFTLEIGSRGYINKRNEDTLKSFFKINGCNDKICYLKNVISKIALVGSYVIFNAKYDKSWNSPAYIML